MWTQHHLRKQKKYHHFYFTKCKGNWGKSGELTYSSLHIRLAESKTEPPVRLHPSSTTITRIAWVLTSSLSCEQWLMLLKRRFSHILDVKIVHKYLFIFLNTIVDVWALSMCAFFINILAWELVGRHVAVADSLMFDLEEFLHKVNIGCAASILTLCVHLSSQETALSLCPCLHQTACT